MAENDRITRRRFMRNAMASTAGIAVGLGAAGQTAPALAKNKRILNYNENMEYRRLGKTNLMVSAVCLGGHWKRINVMNQDFDQNRREVVSRCIDVGINYIDACSNSEVCAYSKALKGRRDKMYLALSAREVRDKNYRTAKKLLESMDSLLKQSDQEYADLWRITCLEPGGRHTFNTSCEIAAALEKAKKQGKARFGGISSHDRRWLKFMIEYLPQIEVVLFPYTARSKVLPTDSLFDALGKCDVGAFGIKPFASNSLFKGTSAPDDPRAQEDNRRARLTLRYVLCNPRIIPIPGLISTEQVDNVAKAVVERRQLDLAEAGELKDVMEQTWAKLPPNYQWLKDWEFI